MKRKIAKAFVAAAVIVSLAACAGPSAATSGTRGDSSGGSSGASAGAEADDSVITLVYAEVNPQETVAGQIAAAFKEKTEELSGGSILIDVQYLGALGAENDVLEVMLSGEDDSIDIARISAFALNSCGAEKSVLLSMPYTFGSREHFWNFAQSDLAQELLNEADDTLPVRGLFYGEEGFRHFFTKKSISSYKDLAGRKIRVSDDPVMIGLVEALGASPTVVSFDELYSSLQLGIVDGAEQPIINYQSNEFPEVAPNLLLDGHTLGALEVIITDASWNKLTAEQQEIIMEAAAYAQEMNQRIVEDAEEQALSELRAAGVNVVEVSEEDKAAMQELCSDLIRQYAQGDLADIYQQIQDMQ